LVLEKLIALMLNWQNKKLNLLILVGIFATGLITYPSSIYLINEWMRWDQALSQGFACLGLVIYFIWRLPLTVTTQEKSPAIILCLLLLGNSLGWCLVQLGNLQLPAYLATLTLIILLISSSFNFSAAKKIAPILGIFLFALPFWSGQFLVELSSLVVGFILQLSDLTLHIQGNQILTPWGTIIIADGCSGLRYFIISLLLAYLLCLLNGYSFKTGAMVFLLAMMLGLFTNWLRITLIVLIGYHTEMTHSLVRDHEMFGWILFAIIMFPALYFAPQYKTNPAPIAIHYRFSFWTLLAWLSGPIIYFLIPFQAADKNPIQLKLQNDYADSWAKPGLFLQYPPADQILNKGIRHADVDIHIELMLLKAKRKDDKLVPYMGQLYDDYKWQLISSETHANSKIETLENRQTRERILLAYRYQLGSWISSSYSKAKLLQIPAKLTNQNYFGFWNAQVICESDCARELSAMKNFTQHW
jgi:exosortase